MKILNKIFFSISIISLAITLYMLFSGNPEQTGPSTIFFLLFLALGISSTKKFKGFTFTVLIFAAVAMSMYYPEYFIENNGFELIATQFEYDDKQKITGRFSTKNCYGKEKVIRINEKYDLSEFSDIYAT